MDVILYVILAYAVLIGCIVLITSNKQKILHWIKTKKNRTFPDDNWDTVEKLKEMKEIEKESFGALGSIRFFLNDPYVTYQFLKETVVPEFNKYAQADEQISPDLPEKKDAPRDNSKGGRIPSYQESSAGSTGRFFYRRNPLVGF